jgi:hypothetical protein
MFISPTPGMIAALVLHLRGGASAEAAVIGLEGAVGGVVSAGEKPAFARGLFRSADRRCNCARRCLKAEAHVDTAQFFEREWECPIVWGVGSRRPES